MSRGVARGVSDEIAQGSAVAELGDDAFALEKLFQFLQQGFAGASEFGKDELVGAGVEPVRREVAGDQEFAQGPGVVDLDAVEVIAVVADTDIRACWVSASVKPNLSAVVSGLRTLRQVKWLRSEKIDCWARQRMPVSTAFSRWSLLFKAEESQGPRSAIAGFAKPSLIACSTGASYSSIRTMAFLPCYASGAGLPSVRRGIASGRHLCLAARECAPISSVAQNQERRNRGDED